jgi:uncharacterized protein
VSSENVELVRRAWEAINRRDVPDILPFVAPDFELRSAVIGKAENRVYRGHEGVERWMTESKEIFDRITFEEIELMDLGDQVLALGRVQARGREGGVDLDFPCGWLHTAKDGKLTAAEGFLEHQTALRAAGLEDGHD